MAGLLFAGCAGTAISGPEPDLSSAAADLADPGAPPDLGQVDLAGVDLAGSDLSPAPVPKTFGS